MAYHTSLGSFLEEARTSLLVPACLRQEKVSYTFFSGTPSTVRFYLDALEKVVRYPLVTFAPQDSHHDTGLYLTLWGPSRSLSDSFLQLTQKAQGSLPSEERQTKGEPFRHGLLMGMTCQPLAHILSALLEIHAQALPQGIRILQKKWEFQNFRAGCRYRCAVGIPATLSCDQYDHLWLGFALEFQGPGSLLTPLQEAFTTIRSSFSRHIQNLECILIPEERSSPSPALKADQVERFLRTAYDPADAPTREQLLLGTTRFLLATSEKDPALMRSVERQSLAEKNS